MHKNREKRPSTKRKTIERWGELASLCKKIHLYWHVKNSKTSARRLLRRLEGLLEEVPKNKSAIVRAEGLALLHELKGETTAAIQHRQNEIQLLEKLHASVASSIEAGSYDARMGESILAGCDGPFLDERRAILQALQEQQTPTDQVRPRRRVS